MTLPLPDENVEPGPGELTVPDALERVWRGVQQNFQRIAQLFPLGASDALFAQFPQCRVHRSTDTGNIASGVWTPIGFDVEDYDLGTPDGNHDGTNTTRLTCRVPGLYTIVANIAWENNAVGPRGARITLNGGAPRLGEVELGNAGGANFTQLCVVAQYRLTVVDYVEVEAMQTSGGNLVVKADSAVASTAFAFNWESP